MSWIKRDIGFISRFIYLFIYWPITFLPRSLVCIFCHHRPPYVRPTARTSDRHQTNGSKDQEQPSISSRDIVGVDQPTNLSGDSLRPDHPTTSLGKKGLELTCYWPKLLFSISPKFVLPLHCETKLWRSPDLKKLLIIYEYVLHPDLMRE